MMRIYQYEAKTYSKTSSGMEYLVDDSGTDPKIFTSKTRCIKHVKKVVSFFITTFGYQLIKDYDNGIPNQHNSLYAATLYNKKTDVKLKINVLEWYTH